MTNEPSLNLNALYERAICLTISSVLSLGFFNWVKYFIGTNLIFLVLLSDNINGDFCLLVYYYFIFFRKYSIRKVEMVHLSLDCANFFMPLMKSCAFIRFLPANCTSSSCNRRPSPATTQS